MVLFCLLQMIQREGIKVGILDVTLHRKNIQLQVCPIQVHVILWTVERVVSAVN